MLQAAFDYRLECEILHDLVVIGKFDGQHPAMACGVMGGRVLLHQPHATLQTQYLNINKELIGLSSGQFGEERDFLVIGSTKSVLIHDCLNNSDVLDKEITDTLGSLIYCPSSTF